jgi:hypothetical protein
LHSSNRQAHTKALSDSILVEHTLYASIIYSLSTVQLLPLKRCMLYVLNIVGQQDSDGDSANNTSSSSKKPMKYKDVVRAQVLAADTAEDAISSDEEGGASRYDNGE